MSHTRPQFSSREFTDFVKEQGVKYTTSSPLFPQSNSMAERMVQTIKHLLRSSMDPYAVLLVYRCTPLEIGCSPAQLLFGRQLCMTLPLTPEQRKLKLPDLSHVVSREEHLKQQQTVNHDAHHAAR